MPGTLPHHCLDLLGDLVQLRQILAQHLDADRRADAGRQHVDARLDRHGPGIGDARKLQGLVHLGDEAFDGHARAPFLLRLQIDDRLEHLRRRRIGRGLGAARLAVDRGHLGEGLDDAVLDLQQFRRLGDRNARQRGRHVEQRALVQVRHELGAELRRGPDGDAQNQKREEDRQDLRSAARL